MDENKAYWSEDQWRKANWRCGHGWLRGEQCEICNAPKREWVGLTPEEILDLFDRNNVYGSKWIEFARAVEAKLKAKND
jgi:hypothetical protein